jgi:hypothetical protein
MTQRAMIRFFLVGLPLGLAICGGVAVYLYYHPLKPRLVRGSSGALPLEARRRPVSERDLREFVRILSADIGARPVSDRAKLDLAANWIASTLGPSNIGYAVRDDVFSIDGQKFRNLSVDIHGQEAPRQVVVVAAHYDTVPGSPGADNNASGVAAVMSLANAFIGESPRRTLQFALWSAQAREAAGFNVAQSGGRAFLAACLARGEKPVALVQLNGLAFFTPAPASQPTSVAGADLPIRSSTGDFIALAGERESAGWLEELARQFPRDADVPVETIVFGGRTYWPGGPDRWPSAAEFRSNEAPSASWLPVPGVTRAVLVCDLRPLRQTLPAPADTLDQLDFERFARVVRGLEAVVRKLSESGDG